MLSVVTALRVDQAWFISTIPIEQHTPGCGRHHRENVPKWFHEHHSQERTGFGLSGDEARGEKE